MNPPKCNEYDYISFLTAGPGVFTCTEAEKVQPDTEKRAAHDPINRLLYRLSPNAKALREEAIRFADLKSGVPISDDSASDKPYAQETEPVTRHRSGKHHGVVRGISLLTMLRSDGDAHIPCGYRIYHRKEDGRTENRHFCDMPGKAAERGFFPGCVLSDSRYAGVKNLRYIRSLSWNRLTRLRSDRLIDPDGNGNIAISSADISETGTRVHLRGYGFINVFRIVVRDGGTEYRATDGLETDELGRIRPADFFMEN